MFRRSRFSVRPNVGTAGRTAAALQEAPSANQEASETPKDASESSTATAVTDNKSVVIPSEKTTAPGDGNDQNGEGTSSSAAVQRRKRFSIKPKVAPGRPILPRTPKSPVKAVSEAPVEVPVSDLDKLTTSCLTETTTPQRLQSPRRRRPSEESKDLKMQPKSPLILSDSSEPSAVPTEEVSLEQPHLPAESGKELESPSGSQVKEVPPRLQDKVPPSLPDKEAIEISEKAKTLVSSKRGLSLSAPAFSLSRLLNDPSDLQRLAKAQKLRELLKQEIHKEKKTKKAKTRVKECTIDPAKMTMRDLIRYLPLSNPMRSSLEETAQENETVVPPSPGREESPERAQEPEVLPKITSPREVEEVDAEEEMEAEEEQDDGVMVPQVKVAEDGTLIIDEESLTVEVQRAKGPNPVQDRDPIFERGSTTTYSSFRKGTHTKPWSSEETDMFFLAISMVGTDFSMICQLFPHRARSEIKNKFKKEERENSWRIDKAFRERRKLDIEYFSKLLEKILEVQKNKKKLKSLAVKKSPKKPRKKAKGKKASRKLSVVEEEDEEEQNEILDLEEEGEKENEDLCNEGGTSVAKPKKKRKRKEDASTEEPSDKKNKTKKKGNEQDEAHIPGDTEAALPEDHPNSDMTESVNEAKNTTIKPAKLSRGRAPKPLLPLGRKWGKKPPPPSTKTSDTASEKEDESVIDEASKEQVHQDASPLRQANQRKSDNDDISSEEEDSTVQPPKPTRYGRVPKPTKPLNYPAKEIAHSSASETTSASPAGSTASAARPKAKCTAKRARSSKLQSAQESKKPKLVTLRASQSEYSDEEDERQQEEEEEEEEVKEVQHPACSSSKDSTAPVFVPAGLRSPHPVMLEVEESVEELDILADMPDVLGISQDALCPDAGTAEPCEHQLDLLVDVIDFLSSENTEVSEDESYNEAAQTLLTIGNLAHLSQSAHSQIAIQDHITGTTSVSVNETSQQLEEQITPPAAQKENSATSLMFATGCLVTEASETVSTVELQNSTKDNDDTPIIKSSDQMTDTDMDPTPQLHSSPESSKTDSPQTRRGCLSKLKPKPNIGQASRIALSKSQQETSTVRTAEESNTIALDLSEATETVSAAEETPKISDCSEILLKDDVSCIDVQHTEEPSCSQKRVIDQVKSFAATSDLSASENQSQFFSEAQFEPSLEQATRDSMSTSGSTNEVLMSHIGTIESSYNNQVISDTPVTELQIGQGSNIDSAPGQESKDHPASCVIPVEELSVSQKEENEGRSTHQIRKSRFQKVKPNVKLAQTSRTVRSKPQTTKDTVEKEPNPTPNPKFHEKTIVEVEAEPTCTTSPEQPSQSRGPASDLIPSLDLGTTLSSTEELSTTEEKKSDVGVVGRIESGATTSDKSASKKRNLSETQFEHSWEQATRDAMPTLESSDEVLMSHVGTTESSCYNLLSSDLAVTESQIGQGSNTESAPVQESKDHPASCVTPVKELLVSQEEESVAASTNQTRKSRFQKVKPNLKLAQTSRTVRSKPQTTKDTVEKEPNPTPNPKFHETVEAEPISTTSPEKPSQSRGPASDLIPSLDLGTTLSSTEELSTTEGKKSDIGVGQIESGATTSDQSASKKQNLSEAQFEHSWEQTTSDATPTLESSDEVLMSHVGTTETSCYNPSTSFSTVTDSQVGQGSNIDSAPVQERNIPPASCVAHVEELPVSQKEESEVKSTCQTKRGQLQKIKRKPNLPLMSRTVRAEPQTAKDPVTPMQLVETPSSPTSKPESTDTIIAEEEAQPTCTTTLPEKSSQIKSTGSASVLVPSLKLGSPHKTAEKLSSTKAQKTDDACGLDSNLEGSEQNVPQRRRRFPKVKPKPNLGSSPKTTRTKLQSNDVVKPSQQCCMETTLTSGQQPVDNNNAQTEVELTESKHLTSTHCSVYTELLSSTVLGPVESEKSDSTNDKCSSSDSVKATSWVAENQSVLTDSVRENKSRDNEEDGSTDSKIEAILPTYTQSTPDPKESTQQPRSANDSEAQSQDALQQCPETNQSAAQRTADNQSEPSDSPSRKAPPTRRGRLIKPKPNLGRSSRPPHPQQVQNTKQAEADSGTRSEGVDALVCHKPVSEHRPDIQEPVEGAIEQYSQQNSSPNDAGSSLGCLTQLPYNCTQDASTSSTGGTQSHHSLTIFPEMLLQQDPSDPDEPFFILSLTEIPVCSLGEDSVPEPLSYLPVTDGSIEQQSVPGESWDAAAGGPLSNVPVSMQESGKTGLINVIDAAVDPAAYKVSQVKQASKTLTAKEAESIPIQTNTTQHSELPGSSVQPKAFDDVVTEPQTGSGDYVDAEMETLTDVEDPEESSFLSETNTPPTSDSPPGKAASKGCKVKTPRAAGKRSTPAPVASTSYDVPPKTSRTEETHSASSTMVDTRQTSEHSRLHSDTTPGSSVCPTEQSEEEPTSVSQYFLNDIFTEVTGENNDETEIPSTKQRLMGTRGAAKLQVNPTTKRKQASKTLTAKEAESIPIQTNTTQQGPGSSVQPKAFDDVVTEPQTGSGDHVDAEKETLIGGQDPEESSSRAQSTRSRRTSSRNRKPSETNNTGPVSDSPPGKAASKGCKVKTPRAAGKRSTPAPVASTSYDVPPKTSPTEETHSASSTTSPPQTEVDVKQTSEHSRLRSDTTPSTCPCPAEVSASQQSDCLESSSVEEEPTSVSQYFVSDTFTEVSGQKNDETEIPPTKQRLMGTRGRAKLQVNPTTKRKQASKTLTAKEAESIPIQTNTTEHSEIPGSSVQPKAFDDVVTEPQKGSGDHVDAEKETLTGGQDPEESSSRAQSTRSRRTSSRNRKPSETNNTGPVSDSPPGKAASKGCKVKTPRAAGKRSTPAPVASTSYDVAPKTSRTEETHSASSTTSPPQTEVDVKQTSEHSRLRSDTTPSTCPCPAEVSASQQSDCLESSSVEEEPTSVSQYFLSDIFTDVEEA